MRGRYADRHEELDSFLPLISSHFADYEFVMVKLKSAPCDITGFFKVNVHEHRPLLNLFSKNNTLIYLQNVKKVAI